VSYSKRDYRRALCPAGMSTFTVNVKETNLWIAVDEENLTTGLPEEVEQFVWQKRRLLEKYLELDPFFKESLRPYLVSETAPRIAVEMVRAGNLAGVGPMAAVAGAFAHFTGTWLLKRTSRVIVENGGDIFFFVTEPLRVGILAGHSPFSGKLSLEINPKKVPRGICTSSGTMGPSYSEGRADAAIILASNTILADAVATATANKIQAEDDLQEALQFAGSIPGVEGVLLVLGKRLAAWGEIKLCG
jgi:ApbE superfamily uncharacterized protein (UPF0280 family)